MKENKKVRKQEPTKKAIKKTRKNFFFVLISFLAEFLFSWFLTFLFSFINFHLWEESVAYKHQHRQSSGSLELAFTRIANKMERENINDV